MIKRFVLPLFSVLAFLPPDAAAITARASGGSIEGGPVLCVAVDQIDPDVIYPETSQTRGEGDESYGLPH